MNTFDKATGTGARVQLPVCARTVTKDMSEEFTLPDYLPEIRKLLDIKACVQPSEGYAGADRVEFGGNVTYRVRYVGASGALYATDLPGEYTLEAPLEPMEGRVGEEIEAYALTEAESVSGRVKAPRKIAIRCRLRADVRAFATCELGGNLPEGDSVRYLERTCDTLSLGYGMGESDTYSVEWDTADLGNALRIMWYDVGVFMEDCRATEGGVICRGDIHVRLTVCREEDEQSGVPVPLVRKLPFEQTVAIVGVDPSFEACAVGVCDGVRLTVEEGAIVGEVSLLCRAWAQANRQVPVVEDLFSLTNRCECEYGTVTLPAALLAHNGNVTLSESAAPEEGMPTEGMTVIDVSARPYVREWRQEKGKICLMGECAHTVIWEADGEYGAHEYSLPFRYEWECPEPIGSCEISTHAITAKMKQDGERLRFDTEIGVCLRACRHEDCRTVTDARLGEAFGPSRAEVVVCYPTAADTLWSVAKRYHVDPDRTAARNRLPADASLTNVAYLIV